MRLENNQQLLMFGEFIDRANFYGIQSILILYLMHMFVFSSHYSLTIYGIYSSLGFISPLIGGYFADKYSNRYLFILFGNLFILLGNLCLLFSSTTMLFMGLDLVIIGIGLFKPNNITLFGNTCTQSGERYTAFTLYYGAMTSGAIVGPFVYSTLAMAIDWKYGFISSIILCLTSAILYLSKLRAIKILDHRSSIDRIKFVKVIVLIVAMFVGIYVCLEYNRIFTVLIWGSGIGAGMFLIKFLKPLTNSERNKQILLIILMCFGLVFYTVSFQVSSVLLLYSNSYVKAKIFGVAILPEYFMSIYAIFLAVSALFSAKIWRRHNQMNGKDLINKINLSLYLGVFSFILIAMSTTAKNSILQVYLILGGLFALGLGELIVGAIINTAIIEFIPDAKKGIFMGLWNLLIGYAAYLSSLMAKIVNLPNYMGNYCSYLQSFLIISVVTLVLAIFMTLIRKPLNNLVHI